MQLAVIIETPNWTHQGEFDLTEDADILGRADLLAATVAVAYAQVTRRILPVGQFTQVEESVRRVVTKATDEAVIVLGENSIRLHRFEDFSESQEPDDSLESEDRHNPDNAVFGGDW